MLFLLFQVKDDRYCLEVSRVIEVTPMVRFRNIPRAPSYVAGLFGYRGSIVPVIDLSALLSGDPCRPLLSTRMILIDYAGRDGSHHVLGLLAEHVTETISCEEEDFQPPGIDLPDSPFLGGVLSGDEGMTQRIEVEKILPEEVQEYLFTSGEDRG